MQAIATSASLATGQNSLYGSLTGADITQFIAAPTLGLAYKLQTSLTHHGNAVQRKKLIRAGFAVTLLTGSGGANMVMETENGSQTYGINVVTGFQVPAMSVDGSGKYLGMTLTGSLPQLTITNLELEYQEISLWT